MHRAYTFRCLHRAGLPERALPPFHYMVANFGGDDVRCAPYVTFGTPELARLAVAALTGRTACLLANHGMIVTRRRRNARCGRARAGDAVPAVSAGTLGRHGAAADDRRNARPRTNGFRTYGQAESTQVRLHGGKSKVGGSWSPLPLTPLPRGRRQKLVLRLAAVIKPPAASPPARRAGSGRAPPPHRSPGRHARSAHAADADRPASALRQPFSASAITNGSVALVSAKVEVRATAPGMLVTQ